MNNMADRRAFLKAIGVAVPVFVAEPAGEALRNHWTMPPPAKVTAEEIFVLYVSEALDALRDRIPGISIEKFSVAREIMEAQGAALAKVISYLEERRESR